MKPLSIAEYNRLEEQALAESSNFLIQALRASALIHQPLPTRVSNENELVRYLDFDYAPAPELYFNKTLGRITPNEYDELQCVMGVVADYSEAHFGKPRVARTSLLRTLNTLRYLQSTLNAHLTRILDIGPGSGYLGMLLQRRKHKYVSTEWRQALYLHQNHLLACDLPGEFVEMVSQPCDLPKLLADPKSLKPIHIPWWALEKFNAETDFKFEVVLADPSLCWLDPSLAKFYLALAARTLKNAVSERAHLLMQGYDVLSINQRKNMEQLFKAFQLSLIHESNGIAIFIHSGNKSPLSLANSNSVRALDYEGRRELILGGIAHHQSEVNDNKLIPFEHLSYLFTAILGTDQHESMDEKFVQAIESEIALSDPSGALQ